MVNFNLEELYRRVALSMGKTPEEVEEGIEDLIRHSWPLLSQQDKMAISSGQYPSTKQFLSYLILQTQQMLEDQSPPSENEKED